MIKMNTITVDIAVYGNVGLWLLLCVDLYWTVSLIDRLIPLINTTLAPLEGL